MVQGLQFVKVRGHDEMWGEYIFERCKQYRNSNGFKQRALVTVLGKQEGSSNIWVLAPEIQIDESGNLIPEEHHSYYWDSEFIKDKMIRPLKISLPLNTEVNLQAWLNFYAFYCCRPYALY